MLSDALHVATYSGVGHHLLGATRYFIYLAQFCVADLCCQRKERVVVGGGTFICYETVVCVCYMSSFAG